MENYQSINLAYEFLSLMDELGMDRAEAIQEIKLVLETEYRREILSEVDEELCYEYKHALADILEDIISLADKYTQLQYN